MSRAFALLFLFVGSSLFAADMPQVVSLTTQRKGDATYFVVTIRPPEDLRMPRLEGDDLRGANDGQRRRLARLPQLVPRDEQTTAVYCGLDLPLDRSSKSPLRFVGKVRGKEKAELLLIYPSEVKAFGSEISSLVPSLSGLRWGETPLTLDFRRATRLAAFGGVRIVEAQPTSDDLEGQWALAQGRHLAVLETQTRDLSFFGPARTLTGRKYQMLAY